MRSGVASRGSFANCVFQNTSSPLKKARLTPWLTAACTLLRMLPDQYSSWPLEMKIW